MLLAPAFEKSISQCVSGGCLQSSENPLRGSFTALIFL